MEFFMFLVKSVAVFLLLSVLLVLIGLPIASRIGSIASNGIGILHPFRDGRNENDK